MEFEAEFNQYDQSFNERVDSVSIARCPECDSGDLTSVKGELVCESCAAFIGSSLDESPEWRFGGAGEPRCSLFVNDLLPDSSYGSYIGAGYQYRKMQKIQKSHSTPQHERSLRKQLEKLASKAFEHGIHDSIRERAEVLYTRALQAQKETDEALFRGNNSDGFLFGGALKQAFIEAGCPRNHSGLAEIAGIPGSYITRGDNTFNRLMSGKKGQSFQKKIMSYTDYINSFCAKLGIMDSSIRENIRKVAERADEHALLIDKNPTSIAAGCIFFVQFLYGLAIHKTKITEKTTVSSVTVNKVNKILMANIDKVLCD